MDRRETVKIIGAAAVTVGTVSLIGGCRGVVRADVARNGTASSAGVTLAPLVADILYHASLAPSGHNTQPWTVRLIGPGRFMLGSDSSRWLSAVDPQNREMLLSLGAFLENLIVAARSHAHDVRYQVVAQSRTVHDVLEVELRRAATTPFSLDKVKLRRTVRGNHLAKELSGDDLRTLTRPLADRFAFYPRASADAKYLEESTFEANRVQAYRNDAQEELSRWIRWRDEDARRHRNGLTPESMEIAGFKGWFVRHFMSRESVMKRRFREQTLDMVRAQLRSYGGWIVLTSPDSTIPTLIETGRVFERMLLSVRERMIAIHPMSQILEEAPVHSEVAGRLRLTGDLQFILRAGYVQRYPDPVSLRMPLESFVGA